MNKLLKVTAIAVGLATAMSVSAAPTSKTAQAIASWDAKAIKDTKSMLVVTPLKSLTFKYAEGLDKFNTQDGAFDITIQGISNATDFELTAKLLSNTLARTSDKSELTIGVSWLGQPLSKSTAVTLVDVKNAVATTSGGLTNIVDGFAQGTARSSNQGSFVFSVESAEVAGASAEFKDLADGYWDGSVDVEFTATWTGAFTG